MALHKSVSGSMIHACAALTFLVLLGSSGLSLAQTSAAKPLKFFELFTSHGCSSCPPADELLGRLLEEQDGLVALEYHVDYWDTLVHGSDGNFADPFSDAAYSARQRTYNAANMEGRPGVYTPQAVINGRFVMVGSSESQIVKTLNYEIQQQFSIAVEPDIDGEKLLVIIEGSEENVQQLAGTPVMFAQFLDRRVTDITGGENRHKTLTNHNIVTSLAPLGEVSSSTVSTFTVPRPADDAGCAVFIQSHAMAPVYAAAYCP